MTSAPDSSKPVPLPPEAAPPGETLLLPPFSTGFQPASGPGPNRPGSPDDGPSLPALFGPPSSGGAAAAAAALLLLVAALLVLMVTWFNEEIPGLPPASPTPVEVAGGRTSASYLFVANGTFLNVTIGVVCAECPFAVAPSSTFGYALTLTNSFNGSLEVQLLTAVPPFHLDSLSLSVPFLIAPGLSEAVDHTLVAPPIGGTAVIPLVISADVG